MATHVSATARQETSHVNRTTRTATIMNALKQRAQETLNDPSLDDQSRATLRYAMEQNDPWLADLVRREEADKNDSGRRKVEALAEIICGAGDQSAVALFVLMGTMQNSNEPAALANTVKHLAFTRCSNLNLYGMVDAQIPVLESELFAEQL